MQKSIVVHQRGQTLIETVIALPIVLLVLFGVIYFTRFGVVNERSQLAVRYGGIFAYTWVSAPDCTGGTCYTANNIYDFYAYASGSGTDPVSCPTPAAGAYANSYPFPGPTSGPYFQPDQIPAPSPAPCVVEMSNLTSSGTGNSFFYNHNFSATILNSQAVVNVPTYLQGIPLLGSSSTAAASGPFVHSAYPALILCRPAVADSFPTTAYTDIFYTLNPNAIPPPQPTCPS